MLAGNELGAVQPDAKIRAQRQRRTQYPFEKSRLDLENLRLERRHDCNGPRSRRSFAEQDHSSRLEIGPLSPLLESLLGLFLAQFTQRNFDRRRRFDLPVNALISGE